MLTAKERRVLGVFIEECSGKTSALITPADLAKKAGGEISVSAAEKIAEALAEDGYFDLVYSDRHGETVYCVSLTLKGRAYKRSVKIERRKLVFRVGVSVALAVMSFVIGLILKAIFR